MDKRYFVYIMTNQNHTVLYTGVTGHLAQRVRQHVEGHAGSFTSKYQVNKLIHVEIYHEVNDAIRREKQIKAGSRKKKIDLVNDSNPAWEDLSPDLFLLD